MKLLKALLKRNPHLWFGMRGAYHALRRIEEPELALLEGLVDPARRAVDVGANAGTYSHRLSRLCVKTFAIEANPLLAAELRNLLPPDVVVIQAAASDRAGPVALRIPDVGAKSAGLATVEATNTLGGADEVTVTVPAIRLSDMELGDVGFIKIDVEGHELAVLRGALDLIRDRRPTILVEAEERHRKGAVASIRDLLEPLGYEGFMLADRRTPTSIAGYRPEIHQALGRHDLVVRNDWRAPKGYVNNFIFMPRERVSCWTAWRGRGEHTYAAMPAHGSAAPDRRL